MAATPPAPASQERVRVSPYPQRRRSPVSNQVYEPITSNIYRLVVQPLVKGFVGERDTSGNALEPFVAAGTTFQEIMEKIWEQFSSHIKGRAVKADNSWTMQLDSVAITNWVKFMAFKVKKHLVDSSKSEEGWNAWLHLMQDKTATLLIYEYGNGIGRSKIEQPS
ncbi:hypothetical protein PR003_g4382 [Phytophthora rubi]|uniref:Uncharacterized protein n=1 Tax=Phytophthora rubi TaxID=129364 RepID=A0A6A3P3D6_9STRA|nr:hypothetical protein PR002_g4287 [Phytophthora rubi]KAE9047591.1 hypothetical protein PR001_g4158 [Phytophthora rubi]KAE9352456.1 hypothetical protein PR003_g4382 [Phytophthora rubi]